MHRESGSAEVRGLSVEAHTTELLVRSREGDEGARAELFERLYGPLRELARGQLRRRSGATLETTELVHEAYLKLVHADRLSVADRSHFFALSARTMRHILVDGFRRRVAAKRGGELPQVALGAATGRGETLLALDAALDRLAGFDPRGARVVEMKFFAGMTEPEIASALDVSVRTVSGDWRRCRAWLAREVGLA